MTSTADDKPTDRLRDDSKLREAFRRGERHALAEVYRVYVPLVSTIVSNGFGGFRGFYSPADRDDALQTVFAAAFEERARLGYNGLDPYSGFLRGITQNVVRRMLDKGTRFRRTDGQENPENQTTDSVEDTLLDVEQKLTVRQFMESVTDAGEQTILTRYFVEGVAEETIAKDLGETRYRVRKTIAQLTKRIQVHLKRYGLS